MAGISRAQFGLARDVPTKELLILVESIQTVPMEPGLLTLYQPLAF